jgi:hypothetical protein
MVVRNMFPVAGVGSGTVAKSESQIINALWEADRKGYPRPLREAIHAARDYGLTDEQIAAELMTTPERVVEMGAPPEPTDS